MRTYTYRAKKRRQIPCRAAVRVELERSLRKYRKKARYGALRDMTYTVPVYPLRSARREGGTYGK